MTNQKTLKQQRLELLIKCYKEVKTLEQTNEELQNFDKQWLIEKRKLFPQDEDARVVFKQLLGELNQ